MELELGIVPWGKGPMFLIMKLVGSGGSEESHLTALWVSALVPKDSQVPDLIRARMQVIQGLLANGLTELGLTN